MRTRKNEIKIRLTDEELAELDAKVKDTHLSRESYIRTVLAGEGYYIKPDPVTWEALDQLRRVGNNLNQLLIHANTMKFVDMPALNKITDEIWACRQEIMNAYRKPSKKKGV